MEKSESIIKIAAALSKAQGDIKNPSNSKTVKVPTSKGTYSYKYAPLDEILGSVRPILSKHGLSILQTPSTESDHVVVTTILLHESGEYIVAPPLRLKMQQYTPQGAGSAITYARRYALSSILGISSEDDDDGSQAERESKAGSKKEAKAAPKSSTSKPTVKTISEKQARRLYAIAATKLVDGKTVDDHVMRKFNKKVEDLITKEYNQVVTGYESLDVKKDLPDTEEELNKGIPEGFTNVPDEQKEDTPW